MQSTENGKAVSQMTTNTTMYSPYYSIDKWKGNKIRKGIHVGLERGNGMRLEKEVDFVMICFSLTLVPQLHAKH